MTDRDIQFELLPDEEWDKLSIDHLFPPRGREEKRKRFLINRIKSLLETNFFTPRQKQMLVLMLIYNKSKAQSARILNISHTALANLEKRVIRKLQKYFLQYEDLY